MKFVITARTHTHTHLYSFIK